MPSTRKQEARGKRSRQSKLMSDKRNLDVLLGGFPPQEVEGANEGKINKMDFESGRPM